MLLFDAKNPVFLGGNSLKTLGEGLPSMKLTFSPHEYNPFLLGPLAYFQWFVLGGALKSSIQQFHQEPENEIPTKTGCFAFCLNGKKLEMMAFETVQLFNLRETTT